MGLALVLVLFGLVAVVFEPLFYLSHPGWWSGEAVFPAMVDLWRWGYVGPFDPIFERPPQWLMVFCWIEVLFFGPLYFASAVAVGKRWKYSALLTLPFAGCLMYSTVVYFILEYLDPVPGTSFLGVFVINAPWTVLPVALAHYEYRRLSQKSKTKRL